MTVQYEWVDIKYSQVEGLGSRFTGRDKAAIFASAADGVAYALRADSPARNLAEPLRDYQEISSNSPHPPWDIGAPWCSREYGTIHICGTLPWKFDIEGNLRRRGVRPHIGAYEYQSDS